MIANFDVVKDNIVNAFDAPYNCDYIAHGCNCHCVMGAGVAKALADKWPDVLKSDIEGIDAVDGYKVYAKGSRDRLGKATVTCFPHNSSHKTIVNMYTQYDIARYSGDVVVDWVAFENALNDLFQHVNFETSGRHVALPEIGCGLAGGEVEDFYAILGKVMDKYPNVRVTIFRL